jgi:hypothetical protein
VDRKRVLDWVGRYEQAWRASDATEVPALFTEAARYRTSPYEPDLVGHAGIQAIWRDDEGQSFTVRAETVAVEGNDAVVRVEVRYLEPVRQEYRDLWVLRFAADGRVAEFEEWPFWPGQPYTATE